MDDNAKLIQDANCYTTAVSIWWSLAESERTEDAALELVKKDYRGINVVGAELQSEAMCWAAIKGNIYSFCYIEAANITEAMALYAVQQDGEYLRYLPKALITEDIVFEAVTRTGGALEYADVKQFKAKALEIYIAAVKDDPDMLAWVRLPAITPYDGFKTIEKKVADWNSVLVHAEFPAEGIEEALLWSLVEELNDPSGFDEKPTAQFIDTLTESYEHLDRVGRDVDTLGEIIIQLKNMLERSPNMHAVTKHTTHLSI